MYVADMHCDTVSRLYHQRMAQERGSLARNQCKVDARKLQAGNYLLQNFAVFVDIGEEKNPYQAAKDQIAFFREELNKKDSNICQARTMEEIEQNKKEGKISGILTLEEGEICQGSVDKLAEFYEEGARMMTFTWNYENSLGTQEGLTELGMVFLEQMEALGMIPDVSHLSEKGVYDVCRYSKKPFAASHSNAAALCSHPRNLCDEAIRGIAESGGVIGINYYGLFLEEGASRDNCYGSVRRIADHMMHVIHTGGIACAGLGSDFDGFEGGLEMSDCSKLPLLERELRGRGLTTDEIEAVFYQNVLRLYRECL